jgi:hypothetical protein
MAHMTEDVTGIWYLADNWHIEDVQSVRPDLERAQCLEVLRVLADRFDANNGINWDVVKDMADWLYPEKE